MTNSIWLWAATVGLVGLASGFCGPMILNPEANQGPLLGLFLTGPAGLAVGAIFGVGMRIFRVRPAVSLACLAAVSLAVAAATLYAATPEPHLEATLVDLQVQACAPALAWQDRAAAEWKQRLSRPGWRETQPGWQDRFARTAIGSVVSATTRRHRQIRQGRAPWNRGVRWATAWVAGAPSLQRANEALRPGEYYSSQSCAAWAVGTQGVFVATAAAWDGRNPPLEPHGVLNMADLQSPAGSLAAFTK